jgi:iron complex transport system substrate-binding protein
MLVRRRPAAAAAALAVATLLSACAGGSADQQRSSTAAASPAGSSGFPVTVTSAAGPVTLDAPPERIVSLSPTATETLFAVGAGEQVVAVDEQSTFPEEAPRTALSGFTPNVEAVAGYRPDLVVVSDDLGGILDALDRLDLPVLFQPAATSLEEAWTQMEALGAATGHAEPAAELVDGLQERIEAAAASVPEQARGLSVYHELDPTLYTVTSEAFIGQVEAELGLVNIADEGAAEGDLYPQLSAEYVVKAAPEVVVLADTQCCQQDAETFAARPGFAELPAVQTGRVLEADDSVASRWGPRLADFAEALAALLAEDPTG